MNLRNKPEIYWSVVILYALGIFLISANPKPPEPLGMAGLEISHVDKIYHFFLYAFFGIAIYIASIKTDFSPEKSIKISFLLGSFYAFTDEIHQSFVPGRSCDALDFLVDAAGIAAGIVFLIWKKDLNLFTS